MNLNDHPLVLAWMFLLFLNFKVSAQADRWQQRVSYEMQIDFDVKNHQFNGKQNVVYTNNSPDRLTSFFYHLYLNAFQPGSMMDVRSRSIIDPDPRVLDRISKLKKDEMGYHEIVSLQQDGEEVAFHVEGTILEVQLATPIEPGQSSVFEMEFESQVPLQIRRNGRDSKEGIDYSMAQWYPKICEYDYQGWHANPYVGREFYGVWGDFDVEITIDQKYTLAATGVLQNKDEIGKGYSDESPPASDNNDKLTWKFRAENVHDFVWAADPDYVVDSHVVEDGTTFYFVYKPGEQTTENWKALPEVMSTAFMFMNENYGKFPYPVYSFIQGGDGGMEYPMATLVTGERPFQSLVGVCVHEFMHGWYHTVLGNNESLYPWMDEGFTTFGESEVENFLRKKKLIRGEVVDQANKHNISGYLKYAQSGLEEPMTTHDDHYKTNYAHGQSAYIKGAVFLTQLEYIMGKKAFRKALLNYHNTWKFKHPNSNDFIRVMEKECNLELDWFKEYFVHTTEVPDYAIGEVSKQEFVTQITLYKLQQMPMPQEVSVTFDDGSSQLYYIPLRLMRGGKFYEDEKHVKILPDWPWTHSSYTFSVASEKNIQSVSIDIENRMVDNNRKNNKWKNE